MHLTTPKDLFERELLEWIGKTRPADERQTSSILLSGVLIGMKLAATIMKEGVNDPYNWTTTIKEIIPRKDDK